MINPTTHPSYPQQAVKEQAELCNDLSQALEDGTGADVTLVCDDGTEQRASKSILSMRSKVFSAMFSSFKEGQSTFVTIKDMNPTTLHQLLRYGMTCKDNKSHFCTTTEPNLSCIFAMYKKYFASMYMLSHIFWAEFRAEMCLTQA